MNQGVPASGVEERMNNNFLIRGTAVGAVGGLVGTIVMDAFGMGLFLALGGPASLSFSIIGDAAAVFFSLIGVQVAGGFLLGAELHYLIGLALGGLLGAAVARFGALRLASAWKALGLGILYVEIMSQPLLAAAAIVLRMTASEAAQWFGVSFVMHLVYGGVLGLVIARGLRPAARPLRP
jgi:hypothetical protein